MTGTTSNRLQMMRELAELVANQVGTIAMETTRPGGADPRWLAEQAGLARDHLDTLQRWAQEQIEHRAHLATLSRFYCAHCDQYQPCELGESDYLICAVCTEHIVCAECGACLTEETCGMCATREREKGMDNADVN